MKLLFNAVIKFLFGIALIGAMLFLPAWSFNYPNAWLFIALLGVPVLVMGAVMLVKSPSLLEKRLNNKESEKTQRGVVLLSAIMFISTFVLSALDFRFSLSYVPLWAVILGAVLFLLGFLIFGIVTSQNEYLSRTVEVQEGQRVIDRGLYSVIRHPMYSATLIMFLSMPLILGSLWAFIPMALYPPIIIIRILNEEKVLSVRLTGYTEYTKRVKYRIIPFIW